MESTEQTKQSIEAKKRLLFQQKQVLDTFLATGALSPEQYEYSLNGLITKLGFDKSILDIKREGE